MTNSELPWQYEDLSQIVENFFQYKFNSRDLLIHSMRHSSYTYEKRMDKVECNERLEFLGDSVLSMVVSEELFKVMSDSDEGVLSQIRSSLVNEKRLSEFNLFMGLDQFLLLGFSEENNGGRGRSKTLCRQFEAFLGAVYQDSNYDVSKKSLLAFLEKYQKEKKLQLFSKGSLQNFDAKSKLQEIFMKKFKTTPRYKMTKLEDDYFKAEVFHHDKKMGFEFGKSKKDAQERLAKKILETTEFKESK